MKGAPEVNARRRAHYALHKEALNATRRTATANESAAKKEKRRQDMRTWFKNNPRSAWSPERKAALAAYRRQWKLERREIDRAKNYAYTAAWKKEARKEDPAFWALQMRLYQYRLTLDQFHALSEAQDFQCAICDSEEPLTIDHDHASGKVRGLLCKPCNFGIGIFKDDPSRCRAAIKYLERN